MYKHVTKDGTEIPLSEMTDSHLTNYLRLLERVARGGVKVQSGGISIGDDEPWYDEDFLYGFEALMYMHYGVYLKEARRRNLNHTPHPDWKELKNGSV